MVSLAKRLEGKPVHIFASFCQRGTKETALALLEKSGWSDEMTNLTLHNQTVFPKAPVKYVPYYLVFDHTGKLEMNHMAGPYHGGDGDNYQRVIKKLLRKIPSEEPAEIEKDGPLTSMRDWTNAEGKTIKASILNVKGETVRLRTGNGQVYNYALSKFSEESRKEIEQLLSE